MESLTPEVAPFGIRTMLVEPGFFRTELLTPESTKYAEPSIDDYAERTRQTVTAWNGMNGRQGGDPAKLAGALIQLAGQDEPPLRFAGRRRRRRHRRAEGTDPPGPGRRPPRPVRQPRLRRRLSHRPPDPPSAETTGAIATPGMRHLVSRPAACRYAGHLEKRTASPWNHHWPAPQRSSPARPAASAPPPPAGSPTTVPASRWWPAAGTACRPSPTRSTRQAAPRWSWKRTSPTAPRPRRPSSRPASGSGGWTSWSTMLA